MCGGNPEKPRYRPLDVSSLGVLPATAGSIPAPEGEYYADWDAGEGEANWNFEGGEGEAGYDNHYGEDEEWDPAGEGEAAGYEDEYGADDDEQDFDEDGGYYGAHAEGESAENYDGAQYWSGEGEAAGDDVDGGSDDDSDYNPMGRKDSSSDTSNSDDSSDQGSAAISASVEAKKAAYFRQSSEDKYARETDVYEGTWKESGPGGGAIPGVRILDVTLDKVNGKTRVQAGEFSKT
eukprot:g1635.t1